MTIAMDPSDLRAATPGADPTSTGTERVSWSSPAKWLWVAETPTAYLGMVDRNHDGFVATSFDGQDLGVYSTRSDAQLAVYSHWFLTVSPVGASKAPPG